MPAETLLIVEQQSRAMPGLPDLLKDLGTVFGLDSYNCRQLLLGPGQALLSTGPAEKLFAIKHSLLQHSILSHVVTPSPISFSPFLLSRLETQAQTLTFFGREKQLILPRGGRVLILLAELSGALIERSLGQILSDHRYRGGAANSGLPLEKLQRAILQGRPVLDIYLLDKNGRPTAGVRAFPGKFDHQGLGERATLSATQNLLQLIALTQEYAGQSRIDMRFGLSPLPHARLNPVKGTDLEGLKKNLRCLTRYAWLQADIDAQHGPAQAETEAAETLTATSALLSTLAPGAAANLAGRQEVMTELSREFTPKRSTDGTPPAAPPPLLLTPPDAQQHNVWTTPRAIAGFLLIGALALLAKFGEAPRWLGPLIAKAFTSGSLTALIAAGCLISGFRLLTLKRLMQNTPTSKIRSIAMGLVEVQGTARRQYALFSPRTDIPCIYYRLIRYRKNQKNDWVVSSITSSGHVPFWLEDNTGRVSVDPAAATVRAGHREESLNHAGSTFGGSDSADEKWVEEMIYDGAQIYVLGEAQVKKSSLPPRQQRRAEALRRIKQDAQKLARYDTNGDGQLDAEEWQAARDEVDEQLLSEDLNASQERKRQEDQVVIGKPCHRGIPFVIAETASEAKLTSRYTLSMTLFFMLGALFGAVSLWLLLKTL
ncbi:GIDE domain-containing protein [Geopsychrobacter electrodiphilus]|uniref:GIDE domain-containing protein n=1 Tax=Geopsychrobacter electrodiphilus TaxID=225196 RepID=UPI0009FCAA38|nr:GIDE domain-containing protein [Geopsychrobacter electrodiphilus]